MRVKNKTVLIFGPTAVGKTDAAIAIAQSLNAEIISADSMQVYRHMDIGTAKPSKDQRAKVPHHLIDCVNPDEEWTVSRFIESCEVIIKDIESRGKTAIIAGGTGLYLNAFINGFSFPIAARDEGIRQKLDSLDTKELYGRLTLADPDAALKINANDKKRVIRALEVYELTGQPISMLQKRSGVPRQDIALFCLNTDRETIYTRINKRVDEMIEKGLVGEVTSLLSKGYCADLKSMQALGYKEVVGYLNNEYSKDDMIELIKKRTRNFARRQLVWFRGFKEVEWVDIGKENDVAVLIIQNACPRQAGKIKNSK